MKVKGLVSIIMNCYNGEKFLNEAIESVINQTYNNWEIIFWDNQSKDNSKKIVESYNDQRIKYYYANDFTILGEARNKALAKAKGEYIAFLDCDDIWLPSKLEKQIKCFSNLEVGIVTCDTYFFNEKKIVKQKYKHNKPVTGNSFKYLLLNALSFETVIIRASVLEKLSVYFDNRFTLINDYDFITRISLNCKLDFVDEVLAKWRIHNTSLTWDKYSLFPEEKRQFLEKMKNDIFDFEVNYGAEIKSILQRIHFQEGIILWQSNSSKKLIKKKLQPYIFQNTRITLLYFMVQFLPVKLYNKIINVKNGIL
jgi:glycosyltransferase involved in cell wall biosynthesis